MSNERARERRWIVLVTDGRHLTLGRHSDPTDEEIIATEHSLIERGLGGWLVVMDGGYYVEQRQPRLMMVRPLASPATLFENAAAAFEGIRSSAVRSSRAESLSVPVGATI